MLGTRLAAASFFVTFLTLNVLARPQVAVEQVPLSTGGSESLAHCGKTKCHGNGDCELFVSPSQNTEIRCKCSQGFIGDRCELETMLSHRCYLRPGAVHEENQIAGIMGCKGGQYCVPDNFWCHFYGCGNSIGWCIKASGIYQSPNSQRNHPPKLTDGPSGSRTGKDFAEELLGMDENF